MYTITSCKVSKETTCSSKGNSTKNLQTNIKNEIL